MFYEFIMSEYALVNIEYEITSLTLVMTFYIF